MSVEKLSLNRSTHHSQQNRNMCIYVLLGRYQILFWQSATATIACCTIAANPTGQAEERAML